MKKLIILFVCILIIISGVFVIRGKEKVFQATDLGTTTSTLDVSTTTNATTTPEDKNPLLTPTQEKALEKVGINPANLPQKITPELKSCVTSKLSEERIKEIKNGSMPSFSEIVSLKSCL